MASNSLLEAMVYGARAGRQMRELAGAPLLSPGPTPAPSFPDTSEQALRELTWQKLGIIRQGDDLEAAREQLESIPVRTCSYPNRSLFELRGMHELAYIIACCAQARKESRGAHFRTDFPEKSLLLQKHSCITKNNEVAYF